MDLLGLSARHSSVLTASHSETAEWMSRLTEEQFHLEDQITTVPGPMT
jgi:hypothetical protein